MHFQGTKLEFMQSYVLETVLCYKEVIENYMFNRVLRGAKGT